MKWIAFAIASGACLLLPGFVRSRPAVARWAWITFGLLPFLIEPLHLYLALRSWAYWPGYVKGIEVTLLDLLSVSLLLSLPPQRHPLRFKVPFFCYAAAVFLSCFSADNFEMSFAYLVQLGRMFLIYAVVAKAASDEKICGFVLKGFVAGILIEAVIVIVQRFGLGELQAAGTFGHQNSLGIASHFVAFPFFAMFVQQRKGWLGIPLIALLSSLVVEILTVSRATIGLAGVGFLLVFLVLAARKWTSRKTIIAVSGVAAILVLVPTALGLLSERNLTNADEYDERAAFERAASLIVSDNPLGIGANHYVVVANSKGYNIRAGVVPTVGSLSAHVHNIYYLVAAETGWLGLVSWLMLIAWTLIYGFRESYRLRDTQQGDLLVGLSTSLLVVYLHSMYEWVFISWALQYFAAICFGLIVGVASCGKRVHRNKFSSKVRKSRNGPRAELGALQRREGRTGEPFKICR